MLPWLIHNTRAWLFTHLLTANNLVSNVSRVRAHTRFFNQYITTLKVLLKVLVKLNESENWDLDQHRVILRNQNNSNTHSLSLSHSRNILLSIIRVNKFSSSSTRENRMESVNWNLYTWIVFPSKNGRLKIWLEIEITSRTIKVSDEDSQTGEGEKVTFTRKQCFRQNDGIGPFNLAELISLTHDDDDNNRHTARQPSFDFANFIMKEVQQNWSLSH